METVYLDTYCEGGYSYQDYLEWCEDYDLEPHAEDSDEYWHWIHMQIEDDIESFFENLGYSECNGPCVVSGHLGLWWGHPEIEPREFLSLTKAIKTCWDGCNDIRITGEDGVIYVEVLHHDGTNRFEIRPESGEYPQYLY